MTMSQVRDVVAALNPNVPSYVSVFAGRIADTGRDPVPMMAAAVEMLKVAPAAELIWASPRELLNIFQADEVGCQVITVTNDILKKLSLVGYDLDAYSLDTVKMFYGDALEAGYELWKLLINLLKIPPKRTEEYYYSLRRDNLLFILKKKDMYVRGAL